MRSEETTKTHTAKKIRKQTWQKIRKRYDKKKIKTGRRN
jgi:hypothetical protein